MEKLSHSNGDGSTMSRQFAPDLVSSDAHAARQMGKSRYGIYEPNAGGSGKKPPVYKFHNGLGDSEPEKGEGKYGGHTPPAPRYDHNAPIDKPATPKKEPYNPQAKLLDDKKSDSRPKASGSDNKPKPNKPNKHTSMPSRPADMPSKKGPYSPPTKKDKK